MFRPLEGLGGAVSFAPFAHGHPEAFLEEIFEIGRVSVSSSGCDGVHLLPCAGESALDLV